jgi:hypothetical protein
MAVVFIFLIYSHMTWSQKYELKLPDNAPVQRFDFDKNGIEGWKTVDGRWRVEEMKDAPSGKRALVQRATENQYNVIVAPGGPYTDVDVQADLGPGRRLGWNCLSLFGQKILCHARQRARRQLQALLL